MPLWIKCTRRSQDGVFAANVNSATIETSPAHRTRFSLGGPSTVEQSPGSVSESTTSSADWRSSLGADDFADAEDAPVWPMPLDGSRRTSRGGSWARADALADKKRLEVWIRVPGSESSEETESPCIGVLAGDDESCSGVCV